MPSLIECCFL